MGWVLVAIHGFEPRILPLPPSGSVVLGREAPADIVVDAPSISRRHASFHVQGEDVFVEDLGSANGTRTVTVVAEAARTAQSVDRRLEPNARTKLEPGVSLHLGNVILVLRKVTEETADEGDVIARSPAMKKIMELVGRSWRRTASVSASSMRARSAVATRRAPRRSSGSRGALSSPGSASMASRAPTPGARATSDRGRGTARSRPSREAHRRPSPADLRTLRREPAAQCTAIASSSPRRPRTTRAGR